MLICSIKKKKLLLNLIGEFKTSLLKTWSCFFRWVNFLLLNWSNPQPKPDSRPGPLHFSSIKRTPSWPFPWAPPSLSSPITSSWGSSQVLYVIAAGVWPLWAEKPQLGYQLMLHWLKVQKPRGGMGQSSPWKEATSEAQVAWTGGGTWKVLNGEEKGSDTTHLSKGQMGEKHRTGDGAKKNTEKLVLHSTFTEGHHFATKYHQQWADMHKSARGLTLKNLAPRVQD